MPITRATRLFIEEHKLRSARYVTRKEFDAMCKQKVFVCGPAIDTFGDGYGEPYNPVRQAFGGLENGECVFTDVRQ